MNRLIGLLFSLFLIQGLSAEDGYRLWLRYDLIRDGRMLQEYRSAISGIRFAGDDRMPGPADPVLAAAKEELMNGLAGLLGKKITAQASIGEGTVLAGLINSPSIAALAREQHPDQMGEEG